MRGVYVLVLMAALGSGGCADDPGAVDTERATVAVASTAAFDDVIGVVAADGATADAARTLAVGTVRHSSVLVDRADTDPELVADFVSALLDADPDTVAPLTAAVVEGLGLALHESLVSYSGLDFDIDTPGIILPLAEMLSSPSRDLRPLADAVREGAADSDTVWGALVAILDTDGTPREGSLLGDVDDDVLATLASDGPAISAPDDLDEVSEQLGPPLRDVLVRLLHTDPAIRAAVDLDGPPDLPLDEFRERPAVAALLDTLTDTGGTGRGRATPAATLARLVVPVDP